MSGSSRISPTAHYTGQVWYRNQLAPAGLATREGRWLYDALQPAMLVARTLGQPTLEPYLLARHAAIDLLLERAIESEGVTQVLELAGGLSARGWRFTQRYGERLTYVEADLPAMAERKRSALRSAGAQAPSHHVREVDVLREQGEGSIAALARELDPERGLVAITEGLLSYLPRESVLGMWRRLAHVLGAFSTGRYISDLHLEVEEGPLVRAFRAGLGAFVRGRVFVHFTGAADAVEALRECGFDRASVQPAWQITGRARGPGHILEASTNSA